MDCISVVGDAAIISRHRTTRSEPCVELDPKSSGPVSRTRLLWATLLPKASMTDHFHEKLDAFRRVRDQIVDKLTAWVDEARC